MLEDMEKSLRESELLQVLVNELKEERRADIVRIRTARIEFLRDEFKGLIRNNYARVTFTIEDNGLVLPQRVVPSYDITYKVCSAIRDILAEMGVPYVDVKQNLIVVELPKLVF